MFNEAMFREILLASSGNVNDYAVHIERKYVDLYRNNKTFVAQYGCSSDEFA